MIVDIILALVLFIVFTSINVSVIYIYRREIKWFFNEVYSESLKRKTPLQKEIEEEQKEIAELKQHKRDMEELEKLKRQEEELFREIKEDK